MLDALKHHWPEYLIEAGGLGMFMVSAFAFGTLLENPSSPVRQALPEPLLRRFFMGLAMGGTALAIIYSPWGKQSGAHINPSITLTFFRLGKIKSCDAAFYVIFQFAGGLLGALVASALLSNWASDPSVNYVVTAPGDAGRWAAFGAEALIAFLLMTVILAVSSRPPLARLTGVCAGTLVALYITFEAPISGMSMNPARTFASAVVARHWADLWIYFSAPFAGMLAAAQVYLAAGGGREKVACAKLHHDNPQRCIFCGKAGRNSIRSVQGGVR